MSMLILFVKNPESGSSTEFYWTLFLTLSVKHLSLSFNCSKLYWLIYLRFIIRLNVSAPSALPAISNTRFSTEFGSSYVCNCIRISSMFMRASWLIEFMMTGILKLAVVIIVYYLKMIKRQTTHILLKQDQIKPVYVNSLDHLGPI